ncbi:MAG: serine hydrolase domain-containing protein [Gemmatimonadales bacterium]
MTLALAGGIGCGSPTEPPFPAGLSRAAVDSLVRDIDRGEFGSVQSLLLATADEPAAEFYFGTATAESLAPLYSVTKSVTALLAGIAVDRGDLADEGERIAPLFPARAAQFADTLRARITIQDLLTMRAGLAWNEFAAPYESPANPFRVMLASPDWIADLLGRPMATVPGTRYAYNSGASVLLGASIAAAAGTPLPDFARERLLTPLGIGEVSWHVGPHGVANSGGGLSMRPRDLVPVGRLVRDRGRYHGVAVVSAAWIDRMLAPATAAPLGAAYGYHWWLLGPDGSYDAGHPIAVALGWGGQVLAVDARTGLILVATSSNFDRDALAFAQALVRRMDGLLE